MSEIEIHHEHGHDADPFGKKIGVLVGIIGILLAAVTIASHREHTNAVIHKTEANDQWAYYQAKRIREHAAETAGTLVEVLASDLGQATAAEAQFRQASVNYQQDADKIEAEARGREADARRIERRALGFDLGEGFMERGLVLSSLYFLGRQRVFPVAGISAAVAGSVLALATAFY